MPTVSVRLLRLSLVALLAGAALGVWLLAVEPWNSLWRPRLRAAHVHLMLFGWLMPFVLGTAHWILPRHASGEERGPARLAAAGAGLIGLGVLLGAAGALAGTASPERGGTACAIAGGALFLRVLWPRVKPFGQGREGGGEGEV
jgi:heme/copper-type cytochrome/quinol oxidase subunit 1